MKLFNAIAATAVIGTSLIGVAPAEATIWSNLDNQTVQGRNDGSADVFITKDGVTKTAIHNKAKMPLKGKGRSSNIKTAKMTSAGHSYYKKLFQEAVKNDKQRLVMRKPLTSKTSRCPAGTSYHKIRVGGLIKRTAAEGCFTAYQASQLRMQANANQQQRIRHFQQNLNEAFRAPRNCSGTINSWGNSGYSTFNTSCY